VRIRDKKKGRRKSESQENKTQGFNEKKTAKKIQVLFLALLSFFFFSLYSSFNIILVLNQFSDKLIFFFSIFPTFSEG